MALCRATSSSVIILPVTGLMTPAGTVCVCVAMIVVPGCAVMCSDSANSTNSLSPDLGASCITILSGSSPMSLASLAVEGAGVLVCVV